MKNFTRYLTHMYGRELHEIAIYQLICSYEIFMWFIRFSRRICSVQFQGPDVSTTDMRREYGEVEIFASCHLTPNNDDTIERDVRIQQSLESCLSGESVLTVY